jgi:hypothetical protein
MPSALPYGNINKFNLVDVTWSPVSVAANTSAGQTVAVPGVILGQDFCLEFSKPTEQAGLSLGQARVSAANTVTVVFVNSTASPIVPTASETYTFAIARRDGPSNKVMS